MDARALTRIGLRAALVAAAGAGLWAMLQLARSVENTADFSRHQPWILLFSIAAVLTMLVLLGRKLWQLYTGYRDHVPGSRLTVRTVGMFGTLVVAPLLIVYLFSLEFINYGIDSWFRVEVKQGLNNALVLSRAALELRMREQSRMTESLARTLAPLPRRELLRRVSAALADGPASRISVYGTDGRLLAYAGSTVLPDRPPSELLLQVGAGRSYVSLQPASAGLYRIRTAAPLPHALGMPRGRYLLVDYDLPTEVAALADTVQQAYLNYGDLSATRQPLKYSFRLTLTLVLLLTLLGAVYGAIWSAQRLARPVQDLIEGTRAVGKGNLATRLPLPSRDEMGFLVHSFNDMTKRLRRTSEEAAASRQAVERERERLAVILSRLSSGVLVLDAGLVLRNANEAAGALLGADLAAAAGQPLGAGESGNALLGGFVQALRARLARGGLEWREQLQLGPEAGGRALLWAATPLPDTPEGLVLVFEDVTALLTAQRSAAWGEVARRLAHEIKNPLTPIQLSAEQLRRKLLPGLDSEHARLLERATHTIVQQVDAMKQMVNAFTEYARAPELKMAPLSLNQLVAETAELYRVQDPQVRISLELDPQLPDISADRGRLRQLLANLLSNGIEALSGVPGAALVVRTRWLGTARPAQAELAISDNGPGFREDILEKAFEPYVTSKARGTGLGLAIVQRIVEEHAGRITAENPPGGGARVRVLLPAQGERRAEQRRERA